MCVWIGTRGRRVVTVEVSVPVAGGGVSVVGIFALIARTCCGLYGRRWDVGAAARGASHPSSDIGEILRWAVCLIR